MRTSNATQRRILYGISIVSLAFVVAIALWWAVSGAHLVTQYQVATTQRVTDEFGDSVEKTTMTDQFQFGLLPDRGYDGAGAIILLGLVISAGSYYAARRHQ